MARRTRERERPARPPETRADGPAPGPLTDAERLQQQRDRREQRRRRKTQDRQHAR